MGGSSKSEPQQVQQTTTTSLSPEGQKLFDTIFPTLQQFAQNTPQAPAPVGFDPLQEKAQQGVLDLVGSGGAIGQLTPALSSAQQFMLGPVLDVNQNPHLQGAVDAAIRPITEQFTQSVLPNIRSGAIAEAGGVGGSRQGISEGLASQAFARQVGDTSSNILSQAYGQGLNAMLQGMNMVPQSQQAMLFPELATEAVGAQRRGFEQEQQYTNFLNEMMPFLFAQDIANMAQGFAGGSATTSATGPGPQKPGAFQSALGGASTGAGIGAAVGGPVGAGVGAALGAVGSLLFK